MRRTTQGQTPVVSRPGRPNLLPRVRTMFSTLLLLMLLAEVIEWLDADTPLWPDRSIAASALLAVLVWSVVLRRRDRPSRFLDLIFAGAVVDVGWGLGRPGAVLTMLLGGLLLRALYGSRRSVALATVAAIVGYAAIGVLLNGLSDLADLNLIVVAGALGAFVAVIRVVGESLAQHDLDVAWDAVVAGAADAMLSADQSADVPVIVADAVAGLREAGRGADGGLLDVPLVPDVVPADGVPLVVGGDAVAAAGLAVRLGHLLTAARLTQERLESDERYRGLAERSRDGIYVRSIDDPERLTYVNGAALTLLAALSPEDAGTLRAHISMIRPDDHETVLDGVGDNAYIEEPVAFRLRADAGTAQDGEHWIEVFEVPFAHADGRVVAVQGTVRDVSRQHREDTALRQALEQQEAAAARLQELEGLRATFLAAVSHELRTPLAALIGAAETLTHHRSRLSPTQSDALIDTVDRQSRRLQRLLDDLLDVERLSADRIEAQRAPTALLPLAIGVVAALEIDTARVHVAGEDVVADVDASQVERIIDNLVRNALKHTAAGTDVRVRITRRPDGALVTVEDDGDGVPSALGQSLFDRFVRGEGSSGAGIGLSLVGRFAALHGGKAWVEDAEGGGARFQVLLPDAPAADEDSGVGQQASATR